MRKLFSGKKRIIIKMLVIFLFAVITEFFIYNFRHWESLTFTDIDGYQVNYSGIEDIDGYFYKVVDPDNAYFEFSGINAPVKNVFFDPFGDNPDLMDSYPITVSITDEGNALYRNLPETEVINGISESLYIRIFTAGKSEKIRINLRLKEGTKFGLSGLGINKTRPFSFHSWRFCLFLALFTMIMIFRPGSSAYQIPVNLSDNRQKIPFIIVLCLNVVIIASIVGIFRIKKWNDPGLKNSLQYNYLTLSLLHGHPWLEFDPPKSLAEMDNPYDTPLRNKVLAETGETSMLDFAYYNGKYYSYFGIVPVLLFYLPYYVITGKQLETAILLFFAGIAYVCAAFWFIYTVIKKFIPSVSLGLFLLTASVFVAGSEITYGMQYPTLYAVPIMLGVLLVLTGVTCWLHAAGEDGTVHRKPLIAGAFCIALVIGCRPPLAIAVLFAFPIFRKHLKNGLFFTKKGLKNTICILFPFLIIGMGVMIYNYIRFDDPLNFGATYNLTGFDMTHRGFIAERFIIGFFEYLFQPFRINPKFPYFEITAAHQRIMTDYQGHLVNEPLMGGFFAYNVIGLILFGLRSFRKKLVEKQLWSFVLFSIIFGLIILAVDIQMVGLVLRYLTDFSIFLMMPVSIIILAAFECGQEKQNRTAFLLTVLLCGLCIAVNYLSLMASGRRNELLAHPAVYYKAKYLLFSVFSIR